MRTSVLLSGLSLVVLAGCHAKTKNPANSDGKVAISGDGNGAVSFNLPFAKGQVTLPEGMMTSANFDIDGVKLMPGSKVTGFNINAGDGGATVKARFMSPEGVDAVKSYFIREFGAKNVTATVAGNRISGSGRDGETFTIDLSQQGNLTQGDINIVDTDKG